MFFKIIAEKSTLPSDAPNFGLEELFKKESNLTPQKKAELQEKAKNLLTRLRSLAVMVGEDSDLRITLGKLTCYFPDLKLYVINTEEFLKYSIDLLLFNSLHEGGHADLTRWVSDFFVKNEVLRSLHNVLEDPRVNNWEAFRFAGAKQIVKSNYDFEWPKQSKKSYGEKVLYYKQFGNAVIYEWAHGVPDPNVTNSLVKEVLDATRASVKKAYALIPDKQFASEAEKFLLAQKFEDILKNEINPHYQKLVDASKQQIRKQVEKALENASDAQGQGQGNFNIPPELIDEDLRQQIEEGLKNGTLKPQNQSSAPQNPDSEKKPGEMDPGKNFGGITEEIINGMLDKDAAKNADRFEAKGFSNSKDQVQREIEKEERRKKLEQDNKNFKPEGSVNDVIERNRMLKEDFELRLNAFSESLVDVAGLADETEGVMENILVANEKPHWVRGYHSGARVNIRDYIQKFLIQKKMNFFEKKREPQKRNYRFSFVLDQSGSMSGDREKYSMQALAVYVEVLERLKVSYSITSFSDKETVHKRFNDDYDNDEKLKAGLFSRIKACGSGCTNDKDAIHTVRALHTQNDPGSVDMHFIIVLTDGSGNAGSAGVPPVLDQCRIALNEESTLIVGVGIGEGVEDVVINYDAALPVDNLAQLPTEIAALLEDFIF